MRRTSTSGAALGTARALTPPLLLTLILTLTPTLTLALTPPLTLALPLTLTPTELHRPMSVD